MKSWLCITNNDNWEVTKEKNIWGVSEKNRNVIQKVRIGDKCLFYIVSLKMYKEVFPSRVVGAYEVISDMFIDQTRIFKSAELYPLRVNLKTIKLFPIPIVFKTIISKLSFIKNKKKWSGHIQGKAMREIPQQDYELMLSLSEK